MKIKFADSKSIPAVLLAEYTKGICVPGESTVCISGLCTDSREADAETAFIAIRGERVDGHSYISNVIQNGCMCVICESGTVVPEAPGVAFIRVDNTLEALPGMAEAYLNTLELSTVAVTGSVGKTTTKDMIAAVLSEHEAVYSSSGNHNSTIGMPLSAMEVSASDTVGVFEMGMSGFGEVECMSLCAKPEIAVITNIGTSHMEMLGSRENIARAKLEVLCGLKKGGTLILNGDEPLLDNIKGKSYRTLYVSLKRKAADFFAQNIRVERDKTTFDLLHKGKLYADMRIPLSGQHNVYAALYAIAVANVRGMQEKEIRQGLLSYHAAALRQNMYSLDDITVYEDCYNASPESVKAALMTLCQVTEGGRVAVLGDMLELGRSARQLHREVGAYVADCKLSHLIAVGALGGEIAEGAIAAGMEPDRIITCPLREDIPGITDALIGVLQPGDTVLFKASRSLGFERIISELKNQYHGTV